MIILMDLYHTFSLSFFLSVKAYELGPGTVCRGIVKRFGKKIEVVNVQA